ncbi:MAG: hypothetical protein ACO3JG_14785 [Luteolibacter sp.]
MDSGPRNVNEDTVNEGAGENKPALRDTLIISSDLIARNLLPRPKILGAWMKEGDLGYVFAPRGHGALDHFPQGRQRRWGNEGMGDGFQEVPELPGNGSAFTSMDDADSRRSPFIHL